MRCPIHTTQHGRQPTATTATQQAEREARFLALRLGAAARARRVDIRIANGKLKCSVLVRRTCLGWGAGLATAMRFFHMFVLPSLFATHTTSVSCALIQQFVGVDDQWLVVRGRQEGGGNNSCRKFERERERKGACLGRFSGFAFVEWLTGCAPAQFFCHHQTIFMSCIVFSWSSRD